MDKSKKYIFIILIIYALGIVIRGITFDFWETELNYLFEIGKYLGNTLLVISIIWSVINGIDLMKKNNHIINLFWLILNFVPIILLLFGLIYSIFL
jgi:hypothetical protein